MPPRQQIGLRKTHTAVHKPGLERRRLLRQAAYDLLCEQDIAALTFRDIAKRAGVPEGSAYHFYANRFDLFTALADDLSRLFVAAHQRAVPANRRRSWQDLAAWLVDVGAQVYAENPPARQLLIGGKTPPEVKQADRMNDRQVGELMYDVFARYYKLADTPELHAAFYYFIEITDLIFTISVIEHGEITPRMLAEAKRAGTGYLGTYLEGVEPVGSVRSSSSVSG
jgi:AcrR family transcriptional regulator